MFSRRHLSWILISLFLAQGNVLAERRATRRSVPRQRQAKRFSDQHQRAARLIPRISNAHGKKTFQTALAFAKKHDLPVATLTRGGQPRLLVNVPSDKIPAWSKAFSKSKCFIEPFFWANRQHKPSWSMLRIGDRSFEEYGRGESYRAATGSYRTAFPVALTKKEMADTTRYIRDSPNGPWNYNGGSPPWSGQNCTNWLTYWIHPFTGVNTNSVLQHGGELFGNNRSGRMAVMAVMSGKLIENFNAREGNHRW